MCMCVKCGFLLFGNSINASAWKKTSRENTIALNLSQNWDLERLHAAEKQQTRGSLYVLCNSPTLFPISFEMPSASMKDSYLGKNFF